METGKTHLCALCGHIIEITLIIFPFFSNIVGPISYNTLSGFDSFTMGATKRQVIRDAT